MTTPTIQQHTGYLLANPHLFNERAYEFALMPLNYPELMSLNEEIEVIRISQHLSKIDDVINESDKNCEKLKKIKKISAYCTGAGAVFGGSSLAITDESAKEICIYAAKILGIPGIGGVIVATLICNLITDRAISRINTYEKDALSVAMQMHLVIQKVIIIVQGSAMFAHLRVTADHQGEIQNLNNRLQSQQQQMLHQQQTNSDLQAQMTRVLNRLEQN